MLVSPFLSRGLGGVVGNGNGFDSSYTTLAGFFQSVSRAFVAQATNFAASNVLAAVERAAEAQGGGVMTVANPVLNASVDPHAGLAAATTPPGFPGSASYTVPSQIISAALDAFGVQYFDLNATSGYWIGFTAGVLFTRAGPFLYAGGAIVPPFGSISLTASLNEPSTGWAASVQGVGGAGPIGGAAVQFGYSFGSVPGYFSEFGIGGPAGFSATVFHVAR
jgi:hypothetical protein